VRQAVSSEAPSCPHCGVPRPVLPAPTEYQPPAYYEPPRRRLGRWDRPPSQGNDLVIAALLSLFLPGVGQMYKGDVGTGIGFLLGTVLGYVMCFFPGLALHIISIVHAARDG
jgi:hypothetical protein